MHGKCIIIQLYIIFAHGNLLLYTFECMHACKQIKTICIDLPFAIKIHPLGI